MKKPYYSLAGLVLVSIIIISIAVPAETKLNAKPLGTAPELMPPNPRLYDEIASGLVKVPLQSVDSQTGNYAGLNAIGEEPKALSGSIRALAVLVDFSDKVKTVNASFFDTLLFELPKTGRGSVRDYFSEISYGQIDIVSVDLPSAIGWKRAAELLSYYTNNNYCLGSYPRNCQYLAEQLVDQVNSVVDFADYDNDNDGYVDNFMIIHAGGGAEFTGSKSDIWSHSWGLRTPRNYDGKIIQDYIIMPEYYYSVSTLSSDMTIGVFAHEMGHGFWNLPDLYDTDYDSYGIESWSLMASGSWNGPGYNGSSPAWPDAWSRIQMGLVQPVNLTDFNSNLQFATVQLNNGVSSVYKVKTAGMATSEYYLMENRQKIAGSYEEYLDGSGLLVWHVDESKTDNDNQCTVTTSCDCGSTHYMIALVQADGLKELEKKAGYADAADPFPGLTNKRILNYSTNPDSGSYYTCGDMKFSLTNISNSANLMTADVLAGDMPQITINDASVTEQDSGTNTVVLTVSLDKASENAVTVYYSTAEDTALSTVDFGYQQGELLFNPGVTTRQISINIIGDTLDEFDEQFFVNLVNPINGALNDSQSVVTIIDNDDEPTLNIQSTATLENSGYILIGFDLSALSGKPVSFLVSTGDDSATAGQDYVSVTSLPVSINAGESHAEIQITLLDDPDPEITEKFHLYISSPQNVIIDEPDSLISILDNDTLLDKFMFLPILLR